MRVIGTLLEGERPAMKIKNFVTAMLLVLCAAVYLNVQAAQDPGDDANLDTQLYLIVGTNQDVDDTKLPASLDPVVKQLRSTLPFKNYRLAATLINRVKNEGRLDLSWIGGPLASVSPAGAASNVTPSFSQFKVRQVKLVRNAENQQIVQMLGFYFGARVPIQTPGAIAANGAVAPTVAYEPTGVSTDISMRESEPVIVGTLNIGPSGDAIILVVSAKRTLK
jgi:hypothetical protein